MSKVQSHLKARHDQPTSLKDATIVIDPGHGGASARRHGPSRPPGEAPNVGISKRLVDELQGARVFLTRVEATPASRTAAGTCQPARRARIHLGAQQRAPRYQARSARGPRSYYSAEPRLEATRRTDLRRALQDARAIQDRRGDAIRSPARSTARARSMAAITTRCYAGRSCRPSSSRRCSSRTRRGKAPASARTSVKPMRHALGRAVKRFVQTDDPGSGFKDPYAKPTPQCPIPGCFEHRK